MFSLYFGGTNGIAFARESCSQLKPLQIRVCTISNSFSRVPIQSSVPTEATIGKFLTEEMANFTEQLEEIKTLLSSHSMSNKPFAYSTLLHLQEHSTSDPSLIQSLANLSHSLLSSILMDIFNGDEEM